MFHIILKVGQRETGKVQKHTKHGIIKLYKFKSPDYMFSVIVKAIIVVLCAYITFSCVNMITNNRKYACSGDFGKLKYNDTIYDIFGES